MELVNFSHSANAKRLLANFSYLSLLQIASYVFPLITYPYLARVIGVDGFGKIAFASAVIMYFQTVVDWGFNYTSTRDIARVREDIDEVSYIFSKVLWAKLFLMVIVFFFFVILVVTIPMFKENKLVLSLTFLLIPGHILFPEWLFQGLERIKYITVLNVLSKLLFTLLIFLVIREKEDFYLQPLLLSCGYLLSGLCALYIIIVKWKIRLLKPRYREVLCTIRRSTDVFLNQLFPNLYNGFSVLLLGAFWGSAYNGIFDAGSKLVNASQQFFRVISRVFFPFLSRNLDKHHLFAKYYLGLSFAVSLLLFVCAPILMELFFTDEFATGIVVLRIISISGFFLTLSDVYGVNWLIIVGKERILRNITIVASLIGFALSFPLVYYWNFIGAAIVIACTRGLLGSLSFLASKTNKLNS